MPEKYCCICGKRIYNMKHYFCSVCYKTWYIPYGNVAWIRFLINSEQQNYRLNRESKNNITLEELELYE